MLYSALPTVLVRTDPAFRDVMATAAYQPAERIELKESRGFTHQVWRECKETQRASRSTRTSPTYTSH